MPGKYHVYYPERRTSTSISLISLSYELNFFQKLALCRGLDFAVPKHVSAIDVKASFEKAVWKLEPHKPEHLRDLTASTLQSVALNYSFCGNF